MSRAPASAGIALCVLSSVSPAYAQARTPRQVVDAVVRDGPRAAAIRAEVEVARREQQARLAFPNPAIAYSREGAGFTEFLQVEQPLPIFGVRGALARAGVAATAAADAERDARLWILRAEASALVSRLQAAERRAAIATADLAEADRIAAMLRVREQEGESSRFDRLRAEQERAELRRTALEADVDAGAARAALQALLPPEFLVTSLAGDLAEPVPAGAAPALDAQALQQRARASRPELRALRAAAEQAGAEGDLARRERWPVLTVSGGMKRADEGDRRETGGIAGLTLAVPLFDTGARLRARWTAEAARLDAERAALEREVDAEIARAAEALARRERVRAAEAAETPAAELASAAEVAYREGEIGVVELVDAMRTASRARQREVDLALEFRLAQIALERAVGEVLWR
jgi:cobalt-zinc-cadmium efflux system outer membrane protein